MKMSSVQVYLNRERDREAMGLLCRTVHITLGQGMGPDTIGFHTHFPSPAPALCTGSVLCE